jgi:hypothetical protein
MGDAARARADFKKAVDLQPSSAAALREDAEATEVWVRYLKEIQDEGDYANWSGPPLDAYRSAR